MTTFSTSRQYAATPATVFAAAQRNRLGWHRHTAGLAYPGADAGLVAAKLFG